MSVIFARSVCVAGDGDSNTFNSVLASNPYCERVEINEIEYIRHVQKRMGACLHRLRNNSQKLLLEDGKSLSEKRKITT